MSKSYKNTIPLFGTKDEIQKAVMSIVTDSSGNRPENVYNIHNVIYRALGKSQADLDALYHEHTGKYKILKDTLVDDIETVVGPMRERRNAISDAEVLSVLEKGQRRLNKCRKKNSSGTKSHRYQPLGTFKLKIRGLDS